MYLRPCKHKHLFKITYPHLNCVISSFWMFELVKRIIKLYIIEVKRKEAKGCQPQSREERKKFKVVKELRRVDSRQLKHEII